MAIAPQRTAQGSPSVLVEPGSHASAGQAAVLRVHARNISGRPQDLTISAVGLEGSWLPIPVAVPNVPADATATVELTLTPPVGAAAGDYPFVVTVEARNAPGVPAATTLADGSLRVDGVSDLVLTVEPADSQALRRRKVQVVLANTGDQPVRVRLDASSDPELDVDLGDGDLDVGPHQTVRIPGSVRARRPKLVGHARRTSFHVTATGARAPQRFDGTVSLRAVFAPALLRFVAITMVAVLWIAGVLAVLPWVSQQFSSDKNDKTVTAQTPAPTTGTDGTQGGGGTEGGGDGDAGTAPGAGGADAAPGVRVSGIVTSSAPAGVTVSVQPASALAAPADSTTTPPPTASGLERSVTALLHPERALVAAVVNKVDAESTSTEAGKVLGTSLPVERTDEISQRRSTTTEDDGTWAFADLSPTARYLIVLAKPGYQTQRFLVTGAQAAAESMKIEMVPGKGTMSGTITGAGGAAGGVEVTLSDGTTTVTTRSATSGRIGYWEVDGLSTPSTYLVSASGEKLGAESALVTLGAAGTRTVNLALSPGVATLSGTVRGIDSLGGFGGLGGLTVTATAGETTRTATTVTGDRAGTFVLPDLPVPASYIVTISGEGYATQTRQIDLTSAGVSPLDITMTSVGGTVQGTVTEPDGTGVAGAGLVLDGPAGTYKTMSASDASGTFRFSGIAPGQYVLTAVVFAHDPASTQVSVVSGGSATADLVLVPTPGGGLTATSFIRGGVRDASTGGQITCPNIFPGETCEVTVTGNVTDASGTTNPVVVSADPDTDYQFPNPTLSSGLLPGLYRLTISAPGYEPGHVNVTVPMGQVVEATTVALEQSPSVVGTVQAHVGAVPDDTCVIAVPGPGSTAPTAPCGLDPDGTRCVIAGAACSFIGINGSYSINRLTSGTYDIWVVPPTGSEYIAPEHGTVSLVPGSSRRFDAILDRLGVLSVTVMRSDGNSQVLPEQNATIVTSPAAQLTPATPPTTNANGLAQVRGLAQGVYTVTANPANGSPGASLANITVGLNQEVSAQLVITSPVANVAGRVVSQLSSGVSSPVGNAHVEVTGTTGFNGLSPLRSTSTPPANTTSNGDFTVCTTTTGCPTDGSGTTLALVEARVDVRVTATGYQAYSATDVPTSALQTITLSPLGTSFKGSVAFDPALSLADTTTTLDKVRFDVRAAPPGVGQLSLTARMVGNVPTVVWSDSAQGTDPALNGARLIRPGSYQVAASLPGYDTALISFVVQPGQAMDPITFTLKRFGFLRVSAVTAQDFTTGVQGSIMTLTLPGGVTQRIEAHPGDTFVDFGDLPTGSYSIDLRAPGYRALTTSVNVSPGQTAVQAQQVAMVKLGALNGTVVSQLTAGWTEALPGASVTATRNGQSFPTTTAADGSYRITGTTVTDGLAGGTWSITTTAPGHANGTGSANVPDPPDFTAPASLEVPVLPIQMVAQRGSLRVFAVASAAPVNGLTMQITYRDALNNVALAPTCVPGSTANGCPGTDGLYEFNDVLPLTYNLNISGGAYSPLTLPVAVAPGETKSVTVPITTPAGSIQGVVLHQLAGGGSETVDGATVTLTPATGTALTNVSDTNGQYKFPSVVPGTYTLSTTNDGLGATRTVTVLPGQGLVVDLVLQDVTRQVVVTVTSANGTDLSGALVTLTGGTAPPAAQPVVRTGAGANTYKTTFNQVAAGTWGISVSGPSGHLGVSTGSVNVPATGTGAVNGGVTVTETQIALRATSSATGAPSTVTATVTQSGVGTDVVVFVGGGDSVVFVPATGATVTGATTGGFTVNVTGGSVASGATYQLVTFDVAGRASSTSATPATQTVSTGGTVTVTTQVSASGANPNLGSVQLQRRTSTGPDVWTDVGASATATGNNQTLTAVADAAWGTGAVTVRVAYSGGGAWGPSTSGNVTVTVQTPTTTTVAFATNVLTATITPSAATGTVAFVTGTNTPIAGCGSVAVTGGTATCAWTPPTGPNSVHANLNGSGVYTDSTSANISVTGP